MFKWLLLGFGAWWFLGQKTPKERMKAIDETLYNILEKIQFLVSKMKAGTATENDNELLIALWGQLEKRIYYLKTILSVGTLNDLKELIYSIFGDLDSQARSFIKRYKLSLNRIAPDGSKLMPATEMMNQYRVGSEIKTMIDKSVSEGDTEAAMRAYNKAIFPWEKS